MIIGLIATEVLALLPWLGLFWIFLVLFGSRHVLRHVMAILDILDIFPCQNFPTYGSHDDFITLGMMITSAVNTDSNQSIEMYMAVPTIDDKIS